MLTCTVGSLFLGRIILLLNRNNIPREMFCEMFMLCYKLNAKILIGCEEIVEIQDKWNIPFNPVTAASGGMFFKFRL